MTSLPINLKQAFAKYAKLAIISAGGFVVLFFVLVSLFWRYQYQTADRLINIAPVDSLAYISVRQSVWPEKKSAITDLPLADYLPMIKQKLNLKDETTLTNLLSISSRASLIVKANDDNRLDYIGVFNLNSADWKTDISEQISEINLDQLDNIFVQGSIVVIASSAEALAEEKEVMAGEIFSLGSQVQKKKIGHGRLSAILSAGNLKSYLLRSPDSSAAIFSRLIDRDIFLNADWINDHCKFKISGSLIKTEELNFSSSAIGILPKDFRLYLAKVNLVNIFSAISAVNENLAGTFRQAIMIGKHDNGEIGNLANWPVWRHADVIVFNGTTADSFGFNWIMALPNLSAKQIEALKSFITDIIAVKSPEGKNYQLPDGTTVTEFFAEPRKWQWQNRSWGINLSADYLIEPNSGLSLVGVKSKNIYFLSNDAGRLEDYLRNGGIPISSLTLPCGRKAFGKSFLIYNNEGETVGNFDYLPEGMFFAVEEKSAISGCFFTF